MPEIRRQRLPVGTTRIEKLFVAPGPVTSKSHWLPSLAGQTSTAFTCAWAEAGVARARRMTSPDRAMMRRVRDMVRSPPPGGARGGRGGFCSLC